MSSPLADRPSRTGPVRMCAVSTSTLFYCRPLCWTSRERASAAPTARHSLWPPRCCLLRRAKPSGSAFLSATFVLLSYCLVRFLLRLGRGEAAGSSVCAHVRAVASLVALRLARRALRGATDRSTFYGRPMMRAVCQQRPCEKKRASCRPPPPPPSHVGDHVCCCCFRAILPSRRRRSDVQGVTGLLGGGGVSLKPPSFVFCPLCARA